VKGIMWKGMMWKVMERMMWKRMSGKGCGKGKGTWKRERDVEKGKGRGKGTWKRDVEKMSKGKIDMEIDIQKNVDNQCELLSKKKKKKDLKRRDTRIYSKFGL
jgi:hypothetical protein